MLLLSLQQRCEKAISLVLRFLSCKSVVEVQSNDVDHYIIIRSNIPCQQLYDCCTVRGCDTIATHVKICYCDFLDVRVLRPPNTLFLDSQAEVSASLAVATSFGKLP